MIGVGAIILVAFGVAPAASHSLEAAQSQSEAHEAVEQLHSAWVSAPREAVPATDERWATLSIPAIGLQNAVVIEGTEAQQINVGVGHYIGTEYPWDGDGNVGLAAHRTGWGQLFHDLDELGAGDVVTITTAEATYSYTVTGSGVVAPTETWVLDNLPATTTGAHDGTPTLTLTTCEGKGNVKRLVVWAELTEVVPESLASE